jgi:hypothetical protein
MRIWVLAAIGALLVGGLPTAAILLAGDDTSASTHHFERTAHGQPWPHGQGPGHRKQKPGKAWKPGNPGQPFPGGGPGRQRLRLWQSLTPQQRATKVAQLARRHAAALDKWAACLQRRHNLRSCPRPEPPKVTKRLSRLPQQG